MTKGELLAVLDGLAEAHSRLLASHMDYTESQARGWPDNPNGYPDHAWSVQIERDAQAALTRAREAA